MLPGNYVPNALHPYADPDYLIIFSDLQSGLIPMTTYQVPANVKKS